MSSIPPTIGKRVWRALTDWPDFDSRLCADIDKPLAVGEMAGGKPTYPGYENIAWQAVVSRANSRH